MNLRKFAAAAFLSLGLYVYVPGQQTATAPAPAAAARFEKYYRTELYMGMSIPGGAMVSDADWEKFLAETVTPLFPDGFTVLKGHGQYREASGTIAKEPSHVVVFLYRRSDRKATDPKIERIRSEYKRMFRQESVLRMDITKQVLVSF